MNMPPGFSQIFQFGMLVLMGMALLFSVYITQKYIRILMSHTRAELGDKFVLARRFTLFGIVSTMTNVALTGAIFMQMYHV